MEHYLNDVVVKELNYRQTFLLHSNTLACVKSENIAHAQEFALLKNCTESLRRSNVYIFYL